MKLNWHFEFTIQRSVYMYSFLFCLSSKSLQNTVSSHWWHIWILMPQNSWFIFFRAGVYLHKYLCCKVVVGQLCAIFPRIRHKWAPTVVADLHYSPMIPVIFIQSLTVQKYLFHISSLIYKERNIWNSHKWKQVIYLLEIWHFQVPLPT